MQNSEKPKKKIYRESEEAVSSATLPELGQEEVETAEMQEATAKKGKVSRQDAELARRKRDEQTRRSRRRMRQVLGIALSVLILVGAYTVIIGIVDTAKSIIYNEEEMSEFETLIIPMVWADTLSFDSPQQLSEETVKSIAFMGIMNENNFVMPADEETGRTMISVVALERYVGRLFGSAYELGEHQTFIDLEEGVTYDFVSDPESPYYLLPNTALTTKYKMRIAETKNEGNGIMRITVGYLSMMNEKGEQLPDNVVDASEPSKYMDFLFQRTGSSYHLQTLRRSTHLFPNASSSSSSSEAEQGGEVVPASQATIQSDPPVSGSGSGAETEEAAAFVSDIFFVNNKVVTMVLRKSTCRA